MSTEPESVELKRQDLRGLANRTYIPEKSKRLEAQFGNRPDVVDPIRYEIETAYEQGYWDALQAAEARAAALLERLETLSAERERYKAGLEAASHFAWSRPPIERRQGSPWNELFALCQAALESHPEPGDEKSAQRLHIMSRDNHDLYRARELIRVIADRLADEDALTKNGDKEMTPELCDYLCELNDLTEHYMPLSVELHVDYDR